MAAVALAAVGCGGTPLISGTGGNPGSGGSLGTGGGLESGTGGVNPVTCAQIASDYTLELQAAVRCTPGAPNQCQTIVATSPTPCPNLACGTQQYVNDDTQLELQRGRWISACTSGLVQSCPGGVCDPPPPVTCIPTSPGATTGMCRPYGSDAGASLAPDGGESCNQLVADYAAAVTAALACTPGAPFQCQGQITPALSACHTGCEMTEAVNDGTAVNAAWQRWLTQCVGNVACPAVAGAGRKRSPGTCVAVDGGSPTRGICRSGND
jgi:hypothetical protein